jgi:hypothetical protein
MPLEVRFDSSHVRSGDSVECMVLGLPNNFAGSPIQIHIRGTDDVTTAWLATLGATVDPEGNAHTSWEPSLWRETVAEVAELRVADPRGDRRWSSPDQFPPALCLINGDAETGNPVDPVERRAALMTAQRERFEVPVGDPNADAALEHRVLCVVEKLLIKTPMRLPGVQILPLNAANGAEGEAALLNALLGELGWPSRVEESWWAQCSRSNRPWSALLFQQVWACDRADAAAKALELRDRVLHLLALNRGSSARPVATVVEQRRGDEVGPFRIYHEDEKYTGNLLGGFISGEDPHALLAQDAAVQVDPLLALATRLYREARGERNPDIAYFRYWSLLEVIADGRVDAGKEVVLLDGSPWPGPQRTTDNAAPRVYELLKCYIRARKIDEPSFIAPAPSLCEAVRGWYARRNATAHYGAFSPDDPKQQGKHWYQRAAATKTGGGQGGADQEPWLQPLSESATRIIEGELMVTGRQLL